MAELSHLLLREFSGLKSSVSFLERPGERTVLELQQGIQEMFLVHGSHDSVTSGPPHCYSLSKRF